MNHQLAGTIFLLFGMSLLGSSIGDLYNHSISMEYESIKSILGIVLGISSSIYGYKRMKSEPTTPSKNGLI